MELMNYCDLFIIFVAECLVSFTGWGNVTFVAFLFPGAFSLETVTIWLVWVSNLSEVPLPVYILY